MSQPEDHGQDLTDLPPGEVPFSEAQSGTAPLPPPHAARETSRRTDPSIDDDIAGNDDDTDDSDDTYLHPSSYYDLIKYDNESLDLSVPADATADPPRADIPGPFEQKRQVKTNWYFERFRQDEIWCLVDHGWFESWKRFVRYSDQSNQASFGQPPGPINNERLVENMESILTCISVSKRIPYVRAKKNIYDLSDYDMVPEKVWNLLFSWYGGFHSGYAPTIARYTLNESTIYTYSTKYMLDVYPFYLNIAIFDPKSTKHLYKEFRFSKGMTLDECMDVCKHSFGVKEEKIYGSRLWMMMCEAPMKVYEDGHRQLRVLDEGDMSGKKFVIEVKRTLRKDYHLNFVYNEYEKPKPATGWRGRTAVGATYGTGATYGYGSRSGTSYSYARVDYTKNSGDKRKGTPGVTGLQNLGNTCFMNSALQCLTKTRCIKDYFTTEAWKTDHNLDNPLGHKGEVAQAFAELMEMIWSGEHGVVVPRGFKWTVGKYNATFQGYRQQDSHELVAFLLDGCHEDLNRITKKPSTETVVARGRPNAVVAAEAWETYKLRNDSKIVDHFLGQLRSELECPICHTISVTFDPYMYLQVPIPGVETREIPVRFIFAANRRPPLDLKVECTKAAQMNSLRIAISNIVEIPDRLIALGEVYAKSVYSFFSDRDGLTNIREHDKVYAFELLDLPGQPPLSHLSYHDSDDVAPFAEVKLKGKLTSAASSSHMTTTYHGGHAVTTTYRSPYANDVLDYPLVIQVKNGVTSAQQVYDICHESILRFLRPEAKEQIRERFNIDVDDPATCFVQPTKEELRSHFVNVKKSRVDAAKAALLRIKQEEERIERYKAYKARGFTGSYYSSYGSTSTRGSNAAYGPNKPLPPTPVDEKNQTEGAETETATEEPADDENVNQTETTDTTEGTEGTETAAGEQPEGTGEEQPATTTDGGEGQPEDDEPRPEKPEGQPEGDGDDPGPVDEDDEPRPDKPEIPEEDKDDDADGKEGENSEKADGDQTQAGGDAAAKEKESDPDADAKEKARLEAIAAESLDLTPEEEAWVAEAPEEVDPAAFHLFTVKALCKSANYHSTAYQRDWTVLYYTPHQMIAVPKPSRNVGYYGSYGYSAGGYQSTPRDRKFFRIRVTVPDAFAEFVDEEKFTEVETHASALVKKEEIGDIDIHDCIRKFCEREVLTKENTWYCRACQEHVCASKKIDLWSLPEVLCVQIKRFTSSPFSTHREKITKFVDYPLVLDMRQHTINPDQKYGIYDLYGVSIHGGGLGFGHYTAYAKAPADSSMTERCWYDFNDSFASRIPDSRVVTSGAYLLFYEARRPLPPIPQVTPGGPGTEIVVEGGEGEGDVPPAAEGTPAVAPEPVEDVPVVADEEASTDGGEAETADAPADVPDEETPDGEGQPEGAGDA